MLYDLHAHISGSIDANSLVDIIYQRRLHIEHREEINSLTQPLGFALADALIDNQMVAKENFALVYKCLPNGKNRFNEAMKRFALTSYLLRLPGIKSQVGESVCRTFREQRVTYIEWRVDPFSSTRYETAEEGLEKLSEYYSGMRKVDLDSRFVLSVSRKRYRNDKGIDYKRIEFLVRQVQNLLESEKVLPIVGIDVSDAESVPVSGFGDMFALAQSHGLGVVPHVGECTHSSLEESLNDIETALCLGSRRLGHAIATYMPLDSYMGRQDSYGEVYDESRIERLKARQKEILQQIKEANVAVEVCPTSNLSAHLGLTHYKEHPVDRLVEMNIPFVVCTDDYGIFGRSLEEEIDGLVNAKGLDRSEILRNGDVHSLKII